DLLLASHRPTDPAFQDIMQIKQNANRAAGLVRQLLAFSRRQTLRPEVMNVGEALSELTLLLKRLLGERVALELKHGREVWAVKADVNQFEQVIVNLAVNARDAMPEGGKLVIRTENVTDPGAGGRGGAPAGDHVLIEVRDTGQGIPPELMEKIFEPFFTTKEIGKGTGLGLSTVFGIVKQSGGTIDVQSTVGEGTAFRIYLPRHVPQAEPEEVPLLPATPSQTTSGTVAPKVGPEGIQTPAARSGDPAPVPAERPAPRKPAADHTGQGTILLVEDEDPVRAVNSRALSARGYTVLEAASGLEALAIVRENAQPIDLVVSDVVMPEMDGPTLLREVRKHQPDLKVIFVSGYAEDAFRKNLPEGETFNFLPKPFSLKQLVETVKKTMAD
ncbi:MAG: response regulator, partial [Parafilimonas terrae]|nr:response regulator [Parafilimonas terrae]